MYKLKQERSHTDAQQTRKERNNQEADDKHTTPPWNYSTDKHTSKQVYTYQKPDMANKETKKQRNKQTNKQDMHTYLFGDFPQVHVLLQPVPLYMDGQPMRTGGFHYATDLGVGGWTLRWQQK